jgi:hypothetical protein
MIPTGAPQYHIVLRLAGRARVEAARARVRDASVTLRGRAGRLSGEVAPEGVTANVIAVDGNILWICACGATGNARHAMTEPCIHVTAVVLAWLSDEITGVDHRR